MPPINEGKKLLEHLSERCAHVESGAMWATTLTFGGSDAGR
jgi:hypothetical protein